MQMSVQTQAPDRSLACRRRDRARRAAIWLLFGRGGDDAPTVEAGSRFGEDSGQRLRRHAHGHARADPRAERERAARSGSDPSAPSADEIARAPQDAVAGLFMVGFAGTNSEASFFKRLKARPTAACC